MRQFLSVKMVPPPEIRRMILMLCCVHISRLMSSLIFLVRPTEMVGCCR